MSFKVENMEEKNMVKLVIEATAEEFEAGLNTAFNKNKNKISVPGSRKGKAPRNAEAIRGFSGTDGFGAFGTAVVSHIDTESGNGTVVNGSNGIF